MNLPKDIKRVECPEPVEGLSWTYILLMRNGMFYVGQTHDVAKRMQRHADGSGSRQARQLKDFVLVYAEGPLEPAIAVKRERQLKKWSRAKKLALIQGDLDRLRQLSQSRD